MKEILREINLIGRSNIITEDLKTAGGNLFIKGILATAGVKNGNGRYYSKDLWEREINKFQQKISNSTTETVGELDHPDSSVINLSNGSHVVRKLYWDGNQVIGIIEIFCDEGPQGTPAGRIAGAMLRNNLAMGISSRGMGSLVKVEEMLEVQDDFELLTWDLVSNPSNPGSYMKKTNGLNENKNNNKNYNRVNSIITDILCSNGTCPI